MLRRSVEYIVTLSFVTDLIKNILIMLKLKFIYRSD